MYYPILALLKFIFIQLPKVFLTSAWIDKWHECNGRFGIWTHIGIVLSDLFVHKFKIKMLYFNTPRSLSPSVIFLSKKFGLVDFNYGLFQRRGKCMRTIRT